MTDPDGFSTQSGSGGKGMLKKLDQKIAPSSSVIEPITDCAAFALWCSLSKWLRLGQDFDEMRQHETGAKRYQIFKKRSPNRCART